MRIAVVVGTRPEAIKLAPVTRLLGREALVVHTGQHFSAGMSGQITPDIVLDAHDDRDMTRGHQLGNLVNALDQVFGRHQPDIVIVQGDTTSALAGALAANVTSTPLVHLEAGLRSFDRAMPEEHHRVLIDHLADLCCAPTPLARDNLLAECIAPERIEVTGNTIVEADHGRVPLLEEFRPSGVVDVAHCASGGGPAELGLPAQATGAACWRADRPVQVCPEGFRRGQGRSARLSRPNRRPQG